MNVSPFYQTNSIEDVLQLVDQLSEKTYVLFDIDKTLIIPDLPYYFEAILVKKIINHLKRCIKSVSIQELVFHKFLKYSNVKMLPVEKNTISVVKTIKRKNLTSFGITARFPSLVTYTLDHVRQVGIDFNYAFLPDKIHIKCKYQALFDTGILFCGRGNNKGDVLVSLFETINVWPEAVICVDDNETDLYSIAYALAHKHIPFIGIHYINRC